MTIGSMFGDIFKSLFKKPITEQYPFVKQDAPENLRGKLVWAPEKCSGCQLCIKDCPSNAIELLVVDKVNKKFVMRYNIDRCTFCAQCVESCRFGCIEMSDEMWELASIKKEPFEVYYGKDEDIQFLLENAAKGETEAPC
ncbi:4Fe-4S dicluster domain-containing protein [bacterium]|nr:4Fe-4S dicluster domain-containing protein [bacterium]